jgi:14-3-3 protein epsilon
MSEATPSDLFFFATIHKNLGRHFEAVSSVTQLVQAKPALDAPERKGAILILKSAIDRYRKALDVLSGALLIAKGESDRPRIDVLTDFQSKKRQEFSQLCSQFIELIDAFLLPHADGREAEVFFHKTKGDLWRYLAEHCDSDPDTQKYNNEAEQSYLRGMDLAGSLKCADPMRIGVVMNYGVFLYEHIYDVPRAIEIVSEACEAAKKDVAEIGENDRAEAERILQLMQTNIRNWAEGDEEEEGE